MTNLAKSPIFEITDAEPLIRPLTPMARPTTDIKSKTRKKARCLSQEDMRIVSALDALKGDLDYLHNCYDQTTDPVLIDSIIYEIKAVNMKYMYYLNLCKEKGIVSSV